MSNWFESHPVRSIIVHTLLVAGSVWAAFAFVFDENKVAVHKAQAENYKAKTEVLEVEIASLREENKKYLDWLTATPNTIPHLEAQLKTSAEEVTRLRTQLAGASKASAQASGSLSASSYAYSETVTLGDTFVDPKTLASIGLAKVTVERTATLTLTLPGSPTRELTEVKPGTVWKFSFGKKNFQVILQRVDWYSNKVTISINELTDAK